MSESFITDDEELDSNPASPKLKANRSPKGVVRRSVITLTLLVAVSVVTALGYRLFSAQTHSTQPSISVKEVVDANSATSDLQMSVDTLQEESPEKTVETQSPQSTQPEFAVDPKIMELLIEIPYEQKQTRDALVYFDDRIDSLIALQPSFESLISNHVETTNSLENRMLAVETTLQSIRDMLDTENTDEAETAESRPPFRLIAIDRWENQWNAVIELDGRITMIQPQEVRAGWKLLEITPSNASAVFRSSSGKQTILKIN